MTHTRLERFFLLCIVCAFSLSLGAAKLRADGLDDTYLAEVRDGFEDRQANALQRQSFTTFPNYTEVGANSLYAWNRLNFALAALFRFQDDPEPNQNFINAANQAIIDVCEQYLQAGPSAITSRDGGEGGMHWIGNHLVRLHEYFGSDSRFYPGLLSEDAESDLRELLWMWISNASTLEYAGISTRNNTWVIRESENHSAMKDQLSWGGAKILRRFEPYKSMEYNDGSTAEEQYQAWNDFIVEYLRERGKRGLFVEYHSNTYTKYTMQNFFNYFDLSEKPLLRELARSVLDLMWADAALGTLDGMVGGAAARNARPADLNPFRNNGFQGLLWYYYGKGQAMNLHPGNMMLMTSDYRIPKVIMDIALDFEGRGSFEYLSRKPGLSVEGKENTFAQAREYWVDYKDSKILRYNYVTPDFVMGTHMFPHLSNARWTNISSQNRFHSALLRAGSDFVQIVPQCRPTGGNNRGLNEQWSIQKYGTLITQKLRTSENVAEMRVYIPSGSGVTVEEVKDWVFIDTGYTYSGVRVATGGYQWQDDDWIELNDEFSPVIVEVARSVDFADFAAFKSAALGTPIEVVVDNGNRRLEYTGLGESGNYVFHMDTNDLPTVDGEPYDLEGSFTYKSPFVNADWLGSRVYIEKAGRSLMLDFDMQLPDPAEMYPQWRESVHVNRRWYHLDGFGWFVPLSDDWMYHYELGFLYAPPAFGNSVWLFLESSEQWIWTSTEFGQYLTVSGERYLPDSQ